MPRLAVGAVALALFALSLGACASKTSAPPPLTGADLDILQAMLEGQTNPNVDVAAVDRRFSSLDLGARGRPIRAAGPAGQRAYLARLRCSDGRAPSFRRIGNYGEGVYGNIIDGYDVRCVDAEPAQLVLFLDMYHGGYVENDAPPGFTITP